MRVVHVVRSAFYGGVENHVRHLCEHALRDGHEVGLVGLVAGDANAGFRALALGYESLGDVMGWSPRFLTSIPRLARTLRRRRPDVVHLHGIRPMVVGVLAARLAGVRAVVCTLHGSYSLMALDGSGAMRPGLRRVARLLHLLGFTGSHRVLVDCEALLDDVRAVLVGSARGKERVIRRKVRVVHNAIRTSDFAQLPPRARAREALGVAEDEVLIGTVSRLEEPKKGVATLLRALAGLVASGAPVRLVVVGKGYSRAELETAARALEVADRVFFPGYWDDLREIYAALDVFALPSWSEGFPTVNLEAMASGLPVVTTDVGGAAEAVRDGVNGFVVPPRDADSLRDALGRLVADPALRRRFGEEGRRRVREEFDVEQMARGVTAAYEELVAGGRRQ